MNRTRGHLVMGILALFLHPGIAAFAQATDDGSEAAPESLVFELTEPRPQKLPSGKLPEGWDEARLERADGLFHDGRRLTLRQTIDKALTTPEPREVLVLCAPETRFERLRAVMTGFEEGELAARPLYFATTRKPRRKFRLESYASSFSSFVFSNGNIVFAGGESEVEDLSEDMDPEDAELPEEQRLQKARERRDRRRIEIEIGPVHWSLDEEADEKHDLETRLKSLRQLVEGKKSEEGRAYLRMDVEDALLVGQLQEVFEAAAAAGAHSVALSQGRDDMSRFLRAFGFGAIGDPVWLPRVVDNGLKALARSQRANGSWEAPSSSELDDLGTTALAMLAFVGEFHSPEEGTFQKEMARALDYLKSRQRENGSIAGATEGFSFSHVLATLALIETYGLTGDDDQGEAAGRAVGFLLRCRNDQKLWGLVGNDEQPDLLVSAWASLALSSAVDVGVDTPEGALEAVVSWLDTLTTEESGQPRSTGEPLTRLSGVVDPFFGRHACSLTAMAGLVRSRAGRDLDGDKRLLHGLEKIVASPPTRNGASGPVDLDYLYFGALLMNVHGGGAWTDWHLGLEEAVQAHFESLQGRAQGIRGLLDADPAIVALLTSCLELSYRYSRNPRSQR